MKKVFYLLITLSLIFGFSCSTETPDSPREEVVRVDKPIIYPASGDYTEGYKDVTITSNVKNAEIYYTTDGSVPTTSSYRYIGKFPIVGTKTVKAIAIYQNTKSSVATNKYNLNAGKNNNQLGVIYGNVNLSDSLSDSVKEKVKNDTIYIYSEDMPGVVKETKINDNYYFDGLDTSKAYSLVFTNQEPSYINTSRSLSSATVEINGKPIIAIKIENQQPVEGAGLNLDATLKATGTISGTAIKKDFSGNQEMDNSDISVYIPGTSYSAITDKNGKFTISGVPQGVYTLRAYIANCTPVEKENVILQQKDNKSIPSCFVNEPFNLSFSKGLLKGVAILNDVISSENGGIQVVVTNKTNQNEYSYSATTNTQGVWSVTDVYPGTYTIEFIKDGYTPAVIDNIIITGAKTEVVPSVTLQVIGGSLKGHIGLSNKADSTGIGLLLRKIVTIDNPKEKSYYGLTDNNGNFFFENVMPGTYKLSASYPGYATTEKDSLVIQQGDKLVGLNLPDMVESSYSVTGKVILEGLPNGYEGTDILLVDAVSQKEIDSTVTNTNGTYCFNNLEIGTYIILASRDGYLTSNDTFINVSASTVTTANDILLKNAKGSIMGTVTLESSLDYSGINILLKSDALNKTYSTVTDTDGHYSFSGIEPGSWTIQATKTGYNTKFTPGFSVSAGMISEPSLLELPVSMRSIFGSIKLEGRTDYTGVRITATKTTSTTEIYSALSNKQGFYALSGMTPGEYILGYSFEGYVSESSSSINVTKESSVQLDPISLRKATGAITGVVSLEGCTDRSGVKVTLVGTDLTYITKADGVYEFNVPAGNYPGGVRFEKEDFATTAKADTIPVLTDSTYAVLDVEMKCNAVTVSGKIDLFNNNDDSGIKVTIDDLDSSIFSTYTASDGSWEIKHVPLGYKTFRFQKEFAADITTEILVEPALVLDLGAIEMVPNAATLKGYVYLKDMSDNRNIAVTVSTPNKKDIVVRTTSDGMFEATNILANVEYNITFSKDGWESLSTTVSNVTPMSTKVIGQNKEFVLSDKIGPSWSINPISINNGANYANKTNLKFDLQATDYGSGLEQMSIQVARAVDGRETEKYPATYRWDTYKAGFNYDLRNLPENYLGTGEYVFYIALKDKAGNISAYEKKSITLTNMVTTLSGILKGPKLHLTKEGGPYIVDANCLVESGDTLVIDPGTEIRFSGNYYLKIDGIIKARGTKEQEIIFTRTEDSEVYNRHDYWDDQSQSYIDLNYSWDSLIINGGEYGSNNGYDYSDGNILEYCRIEYSKDTIKANKWLFINYCTFENNSIGPTFANCIVSNSTFKNGIRLVDSNPNTTGKLFNNTFTGNINVDNNSSFINNNFVNSKIEFTNGSLTSNELLKSEININLYYANGRTINYNNFIDCPSPIFSTIKGANDNYVVDCTANYYGEAYTQELDIKGKNQNISFINDYYDDFNLPKINYENWEPQSIANSGRSEDNLIIVDFKINGFDFSDYYYSFPETKNPKLNISLDKKYSKNQISSMRYGQSLEEIKKANWQNSQSSFVYTINPDKAIDGKVSVYMQVKDSLGNLSAIVCHKIPFDKPIIKIKNLKENQHINGNLKKYNFNVETSDYSTSRLEYVYCDNYKTNWILNPSENIFIPAKYLSSGKHNLKLVAKDEAGQETVKEIPFFIDRQVDLTQYEQSYDSTTGEFKKDLHTNYLWHFNDNTGLAEGDTIKAFNRVDAKQGGLGQSYVLSSDPADDIPLKASRFVSIEYWTIGDNFNVNLFKHDSFSINNYKGSAASSGCGIDLTIQEINGNINNIYTCDLNNLNGSTMTYWAYVISDDGGVLYCNGVPTTVLFFPDGSQMLQNDNLFRIRAISNYDELRISDVTRTPDEINSYYKAACAIIN